MASKAFVLSLLFAAALGDHHERRESHHEDAEENSNNFFNNTISQVQDNINRFGRARYVSQMSAYQNISFDNWEQLDQQIQDSGLLTQLDINASKVKQTFAVYKKMIQQAETIVKMNNLTAYETYFDVETITPESTANSTCDMKCAQFCFTDKKYRFQNVLDVYKVCLVPLCNCTTGDITYSVQELGNETIDVVAQQWRLGNFGTDRDLYDKNGLKIYNWTGANQETFEHRDYNLTSQQWLDTWHEETNTTEHPQEVRQLENYYEELQTYSWISVPRAQKSFYTIEKDCDQSCSEDCLSLTSLFQSGLKSTQPLALTHMVDICNSQRCNCYYSSVKEDPCNNECKRACVLVPGGVSEIDDCLINSCMCEDNRATSSQNSLASNSSFNFNLQGQTLYERRNKHGNERREKRHEDEHEEESHSEEESNNSTTTTQPAEALNVTVQEEVSNTTVATANDTNAETAEQSTNSTTITIERIPTVDISSIDATISQTDSTNVTETTETETVVQSSNDTTADSSAAPAQQGLVLFFDGEMITPINNLKPIDIPIMSIVLTFGTFMTLILILYFILLKHEMALEKSFTPKSQKLQIQIDDEKNIYSQKIKFLDNQEFSVQAI